MVIYIPNVETSYSSPLLSQGHVVLNWKARWFVLFPDKLMYYKYEGGKKDSSKRGMIPLADSEITCPFLEHENRPVSTLKSFCYTY